MNAPNLSRREFAAALGGIAPQRRFTTEQRDEARTAAPDPTRSSTGCHNLADRLPPSPPSRTVHQTG
jgi:hypothetical protein